MLSQSDFISRVEGFLELSESDRTKLQDAYEFGQAAHAGQSRASGESYFEAHPAYVAVHLAEIGMDIDMIIAGLLHDTVEDTSVSSAELEKKFGANIAELVEGVSKLSKVKYRGNERHVESLRKFFVAVADDVRVVILKLCDRWHNLETLEFLKPQKRRRIARESMMIHGHLASRLAMGKLTSTINDLAFPYAYPKEYAAAKEIRDATIKHAGSIVEAMYRDILAKTTEQLGYTPDVDRRIKGIYSLHKKLGRKKGNLEEIYDLIAIRVIVKTESDCYRVLGQVHAKWRPVPGRVKDYIAVPKPNGYQSLHTAVFSGKGPIVEIQVRTKDMHDFAEYGIAAHHSYKG
ncbi:MAG: HD domain-containing protein, partial [Patescibacteria group bacterium]